MVTTGLPEENGRKSEVVDLIDPKAKYQLFPNTSARWGSIGGCIEDKLVIGGIVIVVLIEHIMENSQYDTLKKFENLLLIFEFLMWCWSFWLFYDSSNKYAFWFSTAY